MPDEFFEKYSRLSHEELFAMLAAGDPHAVDALVAIWKSLETTASGLSATLGSDLAKLAVAWESEAGREAQLRLGAIAGFAQMLAEEYAAMQNGLSAMSSALAEAKREAEPPEPATAARNLTLNATVSALTGSADSGVIGAVMGHPKDKEESRNAHDRMARLVAELAADYRVTEYRTWPRHVPSGPAELPQPDAPPPSSGPPPTGGGPAHNVHGGNSNPHVQSVHGTVGKEKDPPPLVQTQPVPGNGALGAAAVIGGVVTATGLAIGGGRDDRRDDRRGDGRGHGGGWNDDHGRGGHHDRGHGHGDRGHGDPGSGGVPGSQLGVNGPLAGASIGEASGLAIGDSGIGEAGEGRGDGHGRYDRDGGGWHDGWRDGGDGFDGHGMHSELVAEPVAVIDAGAEEGLGAATDATGTTETPAAGSGAPGSGGTTTHNSSTLAGGGQHVAGNPVIGGNPVMEPVAGTGTPPPAPVNTGWSMPASPSGVAPGGVSVGPTGAPPAGAVGSPMRMEESRFAFQGDLVRHEATVESVDVDPNGDET